MPDEPTTEELKQIQSKRESDERKLACSAADERELAQHERRAEKARYLRDKLDERAESEREAER
jgi:hypothetical protein